MVLTGGLLFGCGIAGGFCLVRWLDCVVDFGFAGFGCVVVVSFVVVLSVGFGCGFDFVYAYWF